MIAVKKILIVLISLIISSGSIFGQQTKKEYNYSDYSEMRKEFGRLYQEKKYEEAAELMEWALPRFPDNVMANGFNLAIVYGHLQKYDKGIDALLHVQNKGFWFNIWTFDQPLWTEYKKKDRFKEVLDKNEELRKKAQKKAKHEMIVFKPKDYSGDKKYPLFIALHGGGENIKDFRNVWKSPRMESEFIVAYLQSSYVASMTGYTWTQDLDLTEKEIKDAYNKIIREYSVDKNRVIVGGFSSGGVASLEIIMRNSFPAAGFIALCPAIMGSFTEENIKKAAERGIRGTILTTEMDPRVSQQKEMVEMLKKEKLQHEFVITPNVGHWIPDDLSEKIDSSIEFIFNK